MGWINWWMTEAWKERCMHPAGWSSWLEAEIHWNYTSVGRTTTKINPPRRTRVTPPQHARNTGSGISKRQHLWTLGRRIRLFMSDFLSDQNWVYPITDQAIIQFGLNLPTGECEIWSHTESCGWENNPYVDTHEQPVHGGFVFNKNLLQNTRKANHDLAIFSTGGKTTTNLVGDLPGYGTRYQKFCPSTSWLKIPRMLQ